MYASLCSPKFKIYFRKTSLKRQRIEFVKSGKKDVGAANLLGPMPVGHYLRAGVGQFL
jgi:hypothetical protein